MSQIDDLRELSETVGTQPAKTRSTVSKLMDAFSNSAPTPPVSEEEPKPGEYCQYQRYGDGLMPCTATVDKLDAGAYTIHDSPNGPFFVPMKIVTDSLLRLPDSKSDQVIAEIEKFWTLKQNFREFGYAHKRGFLLWGPQGSGKTSTVNVVTRQMIESGGVVFIVGDVHPGLTALMLSRHRSAERSRPAVVILEDIDSIIAHFGEHDVLSLLDGEKAIDNVVYIATTNYPERLEPRVVNRPSRFDQVVKIGMPSPEARACYLNSRSLGLSEKEMDEWVKATEGFSIAHIKEVIISVKCYGVPLDETVARLQAMAQTPKSDNLDRKVGFGR